VTERLIIDASAMVDLLVGSDLADAAATRLRGHELHAPAHFDAEVLSALGRLHRAGSITSRQVSARLEHLAAAPIVRHHLPPLIPGAWRLRHNLRLLDALYVELGEQLDAPVATTDSRLAAAAGRVELIGRTG